MRILVVDDEKVISNFLKRSLEVQGYSVDVVYTGFEAEILATSIQYDLILLDIILPGKSGFDVCRNLRLNNIKTPILILSCKVNIADKILAFDNGADDYLTKPFSFFELLSRISALIRRSHKLTSPIIQIGDLVMDTTKKLVTLKSKEVVLTVKEYAILEYFMHNPGVKLSKFVIEQHVWNEGLDSCSNLIEVYINKLRNKLDSNEKERFIQTIWGFGYRLNDEN